MYVCVIGEALTTEDESDAIVPGPDGRLISTDERMHQIRVGQTESPLPPPQQQTQSSPVHGRLKQDGALNLSRIVLVALFEISVVLLF